MLQTGRSQGTCMHRSGRIGSSRLPCKESAGVIKGPYRGAGEGRCQNRPSHSSAVVTMGRQTRNCPGGHPALSLYCCTRDISPNNKARKEGQDPVLQGRRLLSREVR